MIRNGVSIDSMKSNWVGDVVGHVLYDLTVKRATKYISPSLVLTATARSYRREKVAQKRDGRVSRHEIVLKVGSPNHNEQEYIKLLKKAGMKFPIRNVQLTHFGKVRTNKNGHKNNSVRRSSRRRKNSRTGRK